MKSSEEKKILHAKMILREMIVLERRKKAEIITKNQKVISFFLFHEVFFLEF